MPLPRLDVRARRLAARGAALRARARLRQGRSSGSSPSRWTAWGPFVFVNPDAEAEPLAETLGELPALVAASGVDLGSLRFLKRASGAEYAANWKVCSENFLECYHCQVAHPGFSKVVDVSVDAYVLEESRTFSTQYGRVAREPGKATSTRAGRSSAASSTSSGRT